MKKKIISIFFIITICILFMSIPNFSKWKWNPMTNSLDYYLSEFIGLTDTPTNYTGSALYFLRVNTATNAVEFADFTNVENTALSTWAGTTNITTLGTIATGTWQGTAIANTYGGTGQNSSAWTGYPYVSTGTWSQDTILSRIANGIQVTGSGASIINLADGTDTHIIKAVQEPGLGGRWTLGLDEDARTAVICDAGDIDTDFGLSAANHPRLYVLDNSSNYPSYIDCSTLSLYSEKFKILYTSSSAPVNFLSNVDHVAGHMFAFDSGTNIELVDTDAEQAWMYLEDKYNQTSTAAGGSILVKSLLTSSGTAASGKGYNFFADFRVDDTDDTSLYNIARYHIAKVHSSDLFDAVGLTDSVVIWQQPANSILLGVKMVLETQFTATGLTDLDITLGDVGNNSGILNQTMNLTSDAVGTAYSTRGAYWNGANASTYQVTAATNWTGYATAVGANLNTTSAGEVTFYFVYFQY